MKANEIIAISDELKPNEMCEELKLKYIKAVDARVLCEIHGRNPVEISESVTSEDKLSVPVPYTDMYVKHLLAMISLSLGEHELYKRFISEYENIFHEYAKYYLRSR